MGQRYSTEDDGRWWLLMGLQWCEKRNYASHCITTPVVGKSNDASKKPVVSQVIGLHVKLPAKSCAWRAQSKKVCCAALKTVDHEPAWAQNPLGALQANREFPFIWSFSFSSPLCVCVCVCVCVWERERERECVFVCACVRACVCFGGEEGVSSFFEGFRFACLLLFRVEFAP